MELIMFRIAQGQTYGLVKLADGRILAFDRRDRTPVYLMTKTRTPDGQYPLAHSGSLVVHNGRVAQVQAPARSSARTLSLDAAGNLVTRWSIKTPGGAGGRIGSLIIVDLRDGGLMVLERTNAFRLLLQPAPDGVYNAPPLGSLVVRGGTVSEVNGDPAYDYPDDFAP